MVPGTTLGSLAQAAAPVGTEPNLQMADVGKPPFADFLNHAPPAPRIEPDTVETPPVPRAEAAGDVEPFRGDTLGNELLDSLQRFGDRTTDLQRFGTPHASQTPQSAGTPGVQTALLLPDGPAARPVGQSPAAHGMDGVEARYDKIFQDSMASQANLYSMMIEVNMGYAMSSSTSQTAKTLMTQSG